MKVWKAEQLHLILIILGQEESNQPVSNEFLNL